MEDDASPPNEGAPRNTQQWVHVALVLGWIMHWDVLPLVHMILQAKLSGHL